MNHFNNACRILALAFFFMVFSPGSSAFGVERKIIKVGIRTSIPPYCFVSWRRGKMALRGINVDIMNQVAHHMGVDIKYIKCDSIESRNKMLAQGKIDMAAFSGIPGTGRTGSEFNYVPVGLHLNSRLFVHKSCNTVVCAKDLTQKRVAIIQGSQALMLMDPPIESNAFYMSTPLEALKLLDTGFVDVFIAPAEDIAQFIIKEEGFTNIRRVGLVLHRTNLGIAVQQKNEILYAQLIKVMSLVHKSGAFKKIEDKWYGITYSPSFLERYTLYIYSGIGSVILILFMVTTWNYQLKKKVQKMTDSLQDSKIRYKNLIESSPDMIFVVNDQGIIHHANREARTFLPSSMNPHNRTINFKGILISNDKIEFNTFLGEVFSKNSASREFRLKNASGSFREIDVAATLLPSTPSEEPQACCFARDVTQRNRIERDLVQADRMAIIGQMAADVAHEINNPIGIIRANIDLILARGWFTDEAREFLESCQRNTIRAGGFTKDLLAMARPKTPEMKTVKLWELVTSTLDMMGAHLKRIEITQKTKGEPALVWGDANLLQQVLVNLLLNAVSAMKNTPTPRLTVTCCVPEGSGMARLRVEDVGVGIPKSHLTEIFEPFFTKGKKEGFGLGLFISNRIIENHNGIIYCESELEKGSEFIIEMPLMETRDNRQAVPVNKEVCHET